MTEGHQLPLEGLHRGRMLVRSQEEWREGYEAYMRSRLVFDAFTLAAVFGLIAVGTIWTMSLLGPILMSCVGLVSLAEVLSYNAARQVLREGGARPGVYDNGLEMPMYPLYAIRLFIPWDQMKDAWIKRSRLVDDMLFVAVRGSRWRWRIPGRLLREDGMQAVLARTRAPHAVTLPELVQEAPRLVIYSAEGAKSESVPEETT
jgi:hypothetical protein